MPRRAVPLALALLLSPAVPPLSAGPALAANGADFTPKSQTGRQIDEVYVSAHSSKR